MPHNYQFQKLRPAEQRGVLPPETPRPNMPKLKSVSPDVCNTTKHWALVYILDVSPHPHENPCANPDNKHNTMGRAWSARRVAGLGTNPRAQWPPTPSVLLSRR